MAVICVSSQLVSVSAWLDVWRRGFAPRTISILPRESKEKKQRKQLEGAYYKIMKNGSGDIFHLYCTCPSDVIIAVNGKGED